MKKNKKALWSLSIVLLITSISVTGAISGIVINNSKIDSPIITPPNPNFPENKIEFETWNNNQNKENKFSIVDQIIN